MGKSALKNFLPGALQDRATGENSDQRLGGEQKKMKPEGSRRGEKARYQVMKEMTKKRLKAGAQMGGVLA